MEIRAKPESEYRRIQYSYGPNESLSRTREESPPQPVTEKEAQEATSPPDAANGIPPLSTSRLIDAIRRNIRFESREMPPKSGAIGAVTGHDVFLDEDGLATDLEIWLSWPFAKTQSTEEKGSKARSIILGDSSTFLVSVFLQ